MTTNRKNQTIIEATAQLQSSGETYFETDIHTVCVIESTEGFQYTLYSLGTTPDDDGEFDESQIVDGGIVEIDDTAAAVSYVIDCSNDYNMKDVDIFEIDITKVKIIELKIENNLSINQIMGNKGTLHITIEREFDDMKNLLHSSNIIEMKFESSFTEESEFISPEKLTSIKRLLEQHFVSAINKTNTHQYCIVCLSSQEFENNICVKCGNHQVDAILEKDEEIEFLAYENKMMARKLGLMGLTTEQVTNVCNGSMIAAVEHHEQLAKSYVATLFFQNSTGKVIDYDDFMNDVSMLILWEPFMDYDDEWIKQRMELELVSIKSLFEHSNIK